MVVIVARETAMGTELGAWSGRRCIGLDVHREFAQVAIWQGGLVTQAGRFATSDRLPAARPGTVDQDQTRRAHRPNLARPQPVRVKIQAPQAARPDLYGEWWPTQPPVGGLR